MLEHSEAENSVKSIVFENTP